MDLQELWIDFYKLVFVGAMLLMVITIICYNGEKIRGYMKRNSWLDAMMVLLVLMFSYTAVSLFVVFTNTFLQENDLVMLGAAALKEINCLVANPFLYIGITVFSVGLPAGLLLIKMLAGDICKHRKTCTSYGPIITMIIVPVVISALCYVFIPNISGMYMNISHGIKRYEYSIVAIIVIGIIFKFALSREWESEESLQLVSSDNGDR